MKVIAHDKSKLNLNESQYSQYMIHFIFQNCIKAMMRKEILNVSFPTLNRKCCRRETT